MEKFTWKCVKPLFLKYFILVYTTLHCQRTDRIRIWERIRIRWKFSRSGCDQKGPDPDPQPCMEYASLDFGRDFVKIFANAKGFACTCMAEHEAKERPGFLTVLPSQTPVIHLQIGCTASKYICRGEGYAVPYAPGPYLPYRIARGTRDF